MSKQKGQDPKGLGRGFASMSPKKRRDKPRQSIGNSGVQYSLQ